jgi:chromate reductase, NAD(P)H dehydrogenase (quinone)
MRILAISGSLRAKSSNTAVLRAAARLAPKGVDIAVFDGIGELPFFNPDLDGDQVPGSVAAFRAAIGEADGILICSPEYARGIAGVLKNALDWLVASFEFPNMPVAVINTSPRATHALAALTLTLETMSARLVRDAFVTLPLLGTANDETSIVTNDELAGPLRDAITQLAAVVKSLREA